MMGLLAQAQAHAQAVPVASKQQITRKVLIDIEDELETLTDALEAQFDGLILNQAAMDNAGRAPGGDDHSRMVPFAAKHPAGSVTVYYNGTVVLVGKLAGLVYPA
jgi:hypothetical protein